jgi:hypothetical protein
MPQWKQSAPLSRDSGGLRFIQPNSLYLPESASGKTAINHQSVKQLTIVRCCNVQIDQRDRSPCLRKVSCRCQPYSRGSASNKRNLPIEIGCRGLLTAVRWLELAIRYAVAVSVQP